MKKNKIQMGIMILLFAVWIFSPLFSQPAEARGGGGRGGFEGGDRAGGFQGGDRLDSDGMDRGGFDSGDRANADSFSGDRNTSGESSAQRQAGGQVTQGPYGGRTYQGNNGVDVEQGPMGGVAARGPQGNVYTGGVGTANRLAALPETADTLLVGDQTYYVDGGTYYLPCSDDSSSYCVVPAPVMN